MEHYRSHDISGENQDYNAGAKGQRQQKLFDKILGEYYKANVKTKENFAKNRIENRDMEGQDDGKKCLQTGAIFFAVFRGKVCKMSLLVLMATSLSFREFRSLKESISLTTTAASVFACEFVF